MSQYIEAGLSFSEVYDAGVWESDSSVRAQFVSKLINDHDIPLALATLEEVHAVNGPEEHIIFGLDTVSGRPRSIQPVWGTAIQ